MYNLSYLVFGGMWDFADKGEWDYGERRGEGFICNGVERF